MPSVEGGSLTGRVALVTGAGSGIGRAAALSLAARGACVAVVNRTVDKGESVATEIRAAGGAAEFFCADMREPQQIAQMVEQVLARFGRLDCAFNNAGLSLPPKGFLDHSLADWREVLEVDLTSVFLCMQHQIRAMLATGGGSIVNNGSGASLMGAQGMPHYTAAKHGLIGLMKVAAKEFADRGIRVNTVCPGVIDTVPMRAFVDAIGPAGESFLQTLPGGRMGEPAEVGRVVAWLCSDEAAYISGATISVDGGMLCL
jgi:NAD(P)-dependent dehydrogenase (short-subunit alcohol dehydrogenase family)